MLGFHDKPIVLVDVAGFWQPLFELFDHLYREHFARPESRGAYAVAMAVFVVVAATGALRGRLAASARATSAWRVVHLSAYAAWALAMAHGILAGTDTLRGWALAIDSMNWPRGSVEKLVM